MVKFLETKVRIYLTARSRYIFDSTLYIKYQIMTMVPKMSSHTHKLRADITVAKVSQKISVFAQLCKGPVVQSWIIALTLG